MQVSKNDLHYKICTERRKVMRLWNRNIRRKGFTVAEVLIACLLLSLVLSIVTVVCINVNNTIKTEDIRHEILSYNVSAIENIKYRCNNGEQLLTVVSDYEGIHEGVDGTLLNCTITVDVHKIGDNLTGDTYFVYDAEPSGNEVLKVQNNDDSFFYKIRISTKARGKKFTDCDIVVYLCNKNIQAGF